MKRAVGQPRGHSGASRRPISVVVEHSSASLRAEPVMNGQTHASFRPKTVVIGHSFASLEPELTEIRALVCFEATDLGRGRALVCLVVTGNGRRRALECLGAHARGHGRALVCFEATEDGWVGLQTASKTEGPWLDSVLRPGEVMSSSFVEQNQWCARCSSGPGKVDVSGRSRGGWLPARLEETLARKCFVNVLGQENGLEDLHATGALRTYYCTTLVNAGTSDLRPDPHEGTPMPKPLISLFFVEGRSLEPSALAEQFAGVVSVSHADDLIRYGPRKGLPIGKGYLGITVTNERLDREHFSAVCTWLVQHRQIILALATLHAVDSYGLSIGFTVGEPGSYTRSFTLPKELLRTCVELGVRLDISVYPSCDD